MQAPIVPVWHGINAKQSICNAEDTKEPLCFRTFSGLQNVSITDVFEIT